MTVRPGVRLGIDVGAVRVGVARSDPSGFLATPVETLARERNRHDVTRIAEIAAELEAVEIVVGLPRHMSGTEGAAAEAAREYAGRVARACRPLPVRLVDERLTTVSAHDALRTAGRPGRRHRSVVDQVAAVLILQSALDAERGSGQVPGELVAVPDESEKKETGQ
ncbi:Holliday junction resolvase RuvX [Georgenia wangjunii]|uniref:Holliday junction resolvase RuvX n=1 Tax=Georgenia wangjunii TaxID=3117730 RepID=UPI002F268FED